MVREQSDRIAQRGIIAPRYLGNVLYIAHPYSNVTPYSDELYIVGAKFLPMSRSTLYSVGFHCRFSAGTFAGISEWISRE